METKEQNKWGKAGWLFLRFVLLVFDIIAVNASFYIALLTRFYVQHEIHTSGLPYLEAFTNYAPVYTVMCIVVFMVFRLYSGMWKYIGINDINRILLANLVTVILHVVGTLLFSCRMPITFYAIGSFIQLMLVAGGRLSYRMFLIEKGRLTAGSDKASMNTMIIASGENGRSVSKKLEEENILRPVCILNYKGSGISGMMDGIPYVYGMDSLKRSLEKYHVKLVVIADTLMPQEIRNQIKAECRDANVEVQDYSGFFQNDNAIITLKILAEYSTGPVELVIDGKSTEYADSEQALMNAPGNYVVKSVSARDNRLVIWLSSHKVVMNDINEEWVKKLEEETGEAISFF